MAQNLTIVRLDNFQMSGQVTVDGLPADITGCSLRLTVKWRAEDADASAVFQVGTDLPLTGITVTDQLLGKFDINIDDSLTASIPYNKSQLVYGLLLITPLAARKTIQRGIVTVVPNINR